MTEKQAEEAVRKNLEDYLHRMGHFPDAAGRYHCISPDHKDGNPSMTIEKNGKYAKCWSHPMPKDTFNIFDAINMLEGVRSLHAQKKHAFKLYGIDIDDVSPERPIASKTDKQPKIHATHLQLNTQSDLTPPERPVESLNPISAVDLDATMKSAEQFVVDLPLEDPSLIHESVAFMESIKADVGITASAPPLETETSVLLADIVTPAPIIEPATATSIETKAPIPGPIHATEVIEVVKVIEDVSAPAEIEPPTPVAAEVATEIENEPPTPVADEIATETEGEPPTPVADEIATETEGEPPTPVADEIAIEIEVEPPTPVAAEIAIEIEVEPPTAVAAEIAIEIEVEPPTPVAAEIATEIEIEPSTPVAAEIATETETKPTMPVATEIEIETETEPTMPVATEIETETETEPPTPAMIIAAEANEPTDSIVVIGAAEPSVEADDQAVDDTLGLCGSTHDNRQVSMADYIQDVLGDDQKASIRGVLQPAISTGFVELDKLLDGGLYTGLYLCCSRPGEGKTSFALQIADSLSAQGVDVLFISMDMTRMELAAKSISRLSLLMDHTIARSQARTMRQIMDAFRRMPGEEWAQSSLFEAIQAYQQMSSHLYVFEAETVLSPSDILRLIERHTATTGNRPVVFVDSLQFMKPAETGQTEAALADSAVRALMQISRAAGTPLIALSSVIRDNYACDVVLSLQMEPAIGTLTAPHQVDLKIMKNRHGLVDGKVCFNFYAAFSYFEAKPDKVRS